MTVAPEKLKSIMFQKRTKKKIREVILTGEDFVFGNSISSKSHVGEVREGKTLIKRILQ